MAHKKLAHKLSKSEYNILERFILKHIGLSKEERFILAGDEGFIKGVSYWSKHRIQVLTERLAVDKDYKKCCKIFKCNQQILETIASRYRIPRPKISENWGGERRGDVRRNKKANT